MDKKIIIKRTAEYVENKFKNETSGHDWWHIYRVWNLSKSIAGNEPEADIFIVEAAALLHDIADWKFNNGDKEIGGIQAASWLERFDIQNETILKISDIINKVSFKGAGVVDCMENIEGKIVQDADRLDAIGAIGVARTFAYGGYAGKEIYNPHIKPKFHDSFESYKNEKGHTINHFYEKLLLLKDKMHTETGKKLAEEKHQFMELFLKQFYAEWNYNKEIK